MSATTSPRRGHDAHARPLEAGSMEPPATSTHETCPHEAYLHETYRSIHQESAEPRIASKSTEPNTSRVGVKQ